MVILLPCIPIKFFQFLFIETSPYFDPTVRELCLIFTSVGSANSGLIHREGLDLGRNSHNMTPNHRLPSFAE